MKHFDYKILSENNRVKISIVIPLRGKIFDITGKVLAENRQIYRLIFDKEFRANKEESINMIVSLLDFPEDDKSYLLKKIEKSKLVQVPLYEALNWLQVSKIEENISDLPGLRIDTGYSRSYPTSLKTSHVLGYIGSVSEEDINSDKFEIHPDIKIGKNGIEKIRDVSLRGKPGIKRYEVNAKGNVIKELSIEDSISGESLHLTINEQVQSLAYELLKDEESAAVLINIKTGGIETLLSTPGFDPNQFVNGVSSDYWSEIINNPSLPLTNKAISSIYPPGSSFKLVVCLTALGKGIDPNRRVLCNGAYRLGNRDFHCWKKEGHGSVNMWEAITQSCNCFIFDTARMIGIDSIAAVARELGLGEKTYVELPREAKGAIPQKEWVMKMFKKEWQQGDTLNCSIGQGYVLASPIQLAQMAARLASGKKVDAHLIKKANVGDYPSGKFQNLHFSEDALEVIRQGMYMAVNSARGSAFRSRVQDSEIIMAGKTSTAQVISKRHANDDLSKADVAKKFRNHGMFVGYAPFDDPMYACCVIVEHAGTPRKSINIANQILLEALSCNNYNPK